MKKIAFIIMPPLLLLGCTTSHNLEGKVLDAGTSECEELASKNPGVYQAVCESDTAWQKRDPDGYEEHHRRKPFGKRSTTTMKEVAKDVAIEIGAGVILGDQEEKRQDEGDTIGLPTGERP